MAVKEIVPITDHVDRAIERLPQQFKYLDKKYPDPLDPEGLLTGWEAMITALVKPAQTFENLCTDLLASYDLNNAIGSGLDRLGALVGERRTDNDDLEYRKDIFIKIGANNSEGTYNDLTDLYSLFGLNVKGYVEPAPATFFFNLGIIDRDDVESIDEITQVAKAAGVTHRLSGVINDPSEPIPNDEPIFVFKNGGPGESFATLLPDGNRSEYGGRYTLLIDLNDEEPDMGDQEFGIGSIQMSILNETQFAGALGADASKWVLADGRTVSGSKYTQITANEDVPNMSGLFTRMVAEQSNVGLIENSSLNKDSIVIETIDGGNDVDTGNIFISVSKTKSSWCDNNTGTNSGFLRGVAPLAVKTVNHFSSVLTPRPYTAFMRDCTVLPDPTGMQFCDVNSQNVTFNMANHSHEFVDTSATVTLTGNIPTESRLSQPEIGSENRNGVITAGSETRPVNMSVYYYIKIN